MSYSYDELNNIAVAVKNVWALCYKGGYLPGMSRAIGDTGDLAYQALKEEGLIEIIGGGIFSGLPLRAIISMAQYGHETAYRIQDGYAPYDMKPGFLRSPKAFVKKDGTPKKTPHLVISFRHMTPKSTGDTGSIMTPSVHKAAKGGESFEDQTGTKEDPSDFGLVNSRGYAWQNGPLAGMTNIRDEKGKHSQYRTFRVVSANSAPSSWWHPGVDSNDVVGSVVDYVQPYVEEGMKRAAKAEVVNKINEIFSHPISV